MRFADIIERRIPRQYRVRVARLARNIHHVHINGHVAIGLARGKAGRVCLAGPAHRRTDAGVVKDPAVAHADFLAVIGKRGRRCQDRYRRGHAVIRHAVDPELIGQAVADISIVTLQGQRHDIAIGVVKLPDQAVLDHTLFGAVDDEPLRPVGEGVACLHVIVGAFGDFADQVAVVIGVEHGAELGDKAGVPWIIEIGLVAVLEQHGHGVETKTIDALVHPEAHSVAQVVDHFRITQVPVRHAVGKDAVIEPCPTRHLL